MVVSASEFWDFSLRVYRTSGVESACLELQDKHGQDVNLVLFCCWSGSLGYSLSGRDMGKIIESSGQWHGKVVKPLRAIRRDLKDMVNAQEQKQSLRNTVKKAELMAEKIQQYELAQSLQGRVEEPGPPLARENLKTYARIIGSGPDFEGAAEKVIEASFPSRDFSNAN